MATTQHIMHIHINSQNAEAYQQFLFMHCMYMKVGRYVFVRIRICEQVSSDPGNAMKLMSLP